MQSCPTNKPNSLASGDLRLVFSAPQGLLAWKLALSEQQSESKSEAYSRGDELHDIRSVDGLEARIVYDMNEHERPEHQHKYKKDHSAPRLPVVGEITQNLSESY